MLKKKAVLVFLCFILFTGLAIPLSAVQAGNQTVKVAIDKLNIRKGPGLSYPIVANAQKGEQFPLVSEKNDWMEIQLGNGNKGWVANWLVNTATNSQTDLSDVQQSTAVITTNGLRIRKGPGTNHLVIGTISKGEKYHVLNVKNNWVEITSPFGNGWVSRDFVQLQSENKTSTRTTLSGKVTVSSLNVRNSPSLSSSVIGKLPQGASVDIYSQRKDWVEISFSNRKAWVNSQYIQLSTSGTPNPADTQTQKAVSSSERTGTVTVASLTVRSSASLNGKVIGSVKKGQSFSIIEESNNWAKIEYQSGSFGWVANWYLDKLSKDQPKTPDKQPITNSSVTIIHNGSNIRKSPNSQAAVIQRADQGEVFEIISLQNDWYEIKLPNGNKGYIAGWIVSVSGSAPMIDKPGAEIHLKNKKIVIDPGHGGRDNGTTGARGTLEKTLTMKTAQALYEKLKASGANVVLTRQNDTYIPLSTRVYTSHYQHADVFVSIHYDSMADRTVHGMTTYYYHTYQKNLAATVHSSITSMTKLKDRGYRFGDYYVLRENKRNAILLELGYLSNPSEEILISSNHYQDKVTSAIYNGLAMYFKN